MPYSNLLTQAAYEAQLRETGYSHIEIEDLTSDVFPGLGDYIERMCGEVKFQVALDSSKLRQYRTFARVLRWWNKGKLSFVMVTAVKSGAR